MWLMGKWFSGEHSGAGLTVGLNDFGDLFQPQQVYEVSWASLPFLEREIFRSW